MVRIFEIFLVFEDTYHALPFLSDLISFNDFYNTTNAMFSIGIFLLIFLPIAFFMYELTYHPLGTPPGPHILGWLYVIGKSYIENDSRNIIEKMKHRYNDIIAMKSVGRPMVVLLNEFNIIESAFVKNAAVFSRRPKSFFLNITKGHGILNNDGDSWVLQRKITVGKLLAHSGNMHNFERILQAEAKRISDRLKTQHGEPHDNEPHLNKCVLRIILSLIGGHSEFAEYELENIISELDIVYEKLANPTYTFFSFLQFIPTDPFKFQRIIDAINWGITFSKSIVHQRYASRENKPRSSANAGEQDFLESYMERMEAKGKHNEDFSSEHLSSIILDLVACGVGPTTVTLQWALMYLSQNIDVQEKVRREINDVIGSGTPRISNRLDMPYTQATIMEIQRISHVCWLTSPRYIKQDVQFNGYLLTKESIILADTSVVLMDEHLFPNPHEFRPARFINQEGTVTTPKEFIPFGIGPRACIGAKLAKDTLFVILTTLLQQFEFLPPEREVLPAGEGQNYLFHAPPSFRVRVSSLYGHWTGVLTLRSLDRCLHSTDIGRVFSLYGHWTGDLTLRSLDGCPHSTVNGRVFSLYGHWTGVLTLRSLDKCLHSTDIGRVSSLYGKWTGVLTLRSLDGCSHSTVNGHVSSLYGHWTGVFTLRSLDGRLYSTVIRRVSSLYGHWTGVLTLRSMDGCPHSTVI
ncbi:hypothetical protein ScPMuIL_002382 [Solemya velum]